MQYIALLSVIGVLVLQATGAIPMSSVGGPMVIAMVGFAATFAVAIHEAWRMKRGVLGWILNIVVTFFGVVVFAPFGSLVLVPILSPFMTGGGSFAAEGGPVMTLALAGMMGIVVLSAWGSLWFLNLLRDRRPPAGAASNPGN